MKSMKRFWVLAAVLSSVASALIHTYLAYHSYELKFGFSEGHSLCNVNDHFNCDAVSLSRFANFMGIPLAAWGLATHLFMIFLLIIWSVGLAQNRERILSFARWLSVLILAASLMMGGISILALSTYCLFCIGTYVLSLLLWASLSFASAGSEETRNPLSLFKDIWSEHRWMLVGLFLVPVFSYTIHLMMVDSFGVKDLDVLVSSSLEAWTADTEKSFTEEGLVFQNGTGPAVMTIVEFADFLCPHCQAAYQPLHSFISGHAGAKLVLKLYPLDGSCNPDIKEHGDNVRCILASAAYCADSLNHKGWALADLIFEDQASWNSGNVRSKLNQTLGALALDEKAMNECIDSTATNSRVQKTAQEGHGISGTPTLFVNGKQLRHGQILAFLSAAAKSLGL